MTRATKPFTAQVHQAHIILSDNCSGDIYYAVPGGATWDGGNGTIAASGLNAVNTSSFGDDANGDLYVADLNGRILLLQTDTIFADGFDNGSRLL
ncbi:MAG TPA: hypothetical protein VL425_03135, partial [Rudaea sp.]|nr:hypothetical protein [Rudaea sp.]